MRKLETKTHDAIELLPDLFGPLTDAQHKLLKKSLTLQTYKKGEVIYEEGEHPMYLYCLLEGKVKVYKHGVGGRNQIVCVYKSVQYFGYRAYFCGQNYATSSAAFEKCVIAKIPLKVFTSVVRENTQLSWYIIRNLSSQLGIVSERSVNLTQKHIRARLAESLLFLKKSYGLEEDNCTLSIYLSREDLACLSNMTTANAIRTLSQFASEKMVIIDGRKIKIIKESELEKISQMG